MASTELTCTGSHSTHTKPDMGPLSLPVLGLEPIIFAVFANL